MAEAVVVFEGLKEPVLVPDEVIVFVAAGVIVMVLLAPIDLLTVVVAVPVLVWETERVGLADPVLVLEDVTEPVVVPERLMVRVPLAVLEPDEDPVDVFEGPVERVPLGDADGVLDNPGVRESVGLDEPVLDDVVVPVLVADLFPETVHLDVDVCVLDPAVVAVAIDVPEPVLEEVDVLVDVIDTVFVLVVVVEGLGSIVNLADFDNVVVLVDVFDIVEVAVAMIPIALRPRSSTEEKDKVGENDASSNNASRSICPGLLKKLIGQSQI